MYWSDRKKIFIIHGKGRIGGEGEEVGGDLDTIVSNVFYGVWCRGMIDQRYYRKAIYGQDYEFDFVNYHEGLAHLSIHKGCDVFLPDFPLDAIPDLTGDVHFLAKNDVKIVRIDDHHPWTDEAIQELQQLVDQQFLTTFIIDGPKKGEDVPRENQVCGADIIYREFIQNSEFDNPGLAELRHLAHIQDLHLEENPLALKLSKLIASGHSKIDIVLRLMEISSLDDMINILTITGWDKEISVYERQLRRAAPKLDNNLVLCEFIKPVGSQELKQDEVLTAMKSRLGFLSFLLPFSFLFQKKRRRWFIKWLYSQRHQNVIRILISLAPYRGEGEVRINVASAIEYLTKKITMNYFFYCYGSFLMTTRNVYDPDCYLDLSLLMPFIGKEGDGGHREAASCKPAENENFDKDKFERVNANNFFEYAQYLSKKVQDFSGLELKQVKKIGH